MKILFAFLAMMLTAFLPAYSGETVVDARPKQAAMTISYETRTDAKGKTKYEMVITHQTGIVSFYDEIDLLEWRDEAVRRLSELNAEIARIDEQVNEIKKIKPK